MSDIVERLRGYSALATNGIPIYDEAADEIERLRALLQEALRAPVEGKRWGEEL